MNNRLKQFRHNLGLVFDDDLGTRQWYNIVDWVIVFMILLSSVEIFMSTLPFGDRMMRVLDTINTVTLIFFVVEVTLRIWAAPEQDPRFSGFRGRVRYCMTFYGFIDLISTYPFLVQFFCPLSLGALRILRIARIIRVFRITRYASSFNLLSDSIREKRNELMVSMQFLVIITFILSIMLYVYEHDAQPEVYDNGVRSVLWSFAQYIGDPGQFADTPPITFPGRVIACIIGVLGIAIVAVPAGILGAGFTEAIERKAKEKEMAENAEKLRLSFERKLDRPTGFQTVPPFHPIPHIQARQAMTADEIISTVNETDGFRLVNLASTIPIDKNPIDRLAVEHYAFNRPYGLCIDRGSKVTVIAPASFIDACTGFYAYYLAKIGGFNYISREFGCVAPYRSFYVVNDDANEEAGFEEYVDDLKKLTSRPGAWTLTSLVASGAMEPEYDTAFHFGTGSPKGDESVGNLVADKERFRQFYDHVAATLFEATGLKSDAGRYHNTASKNNLMRKLPEFAQANHIILRTAWSAMLWNPQRIEIATIIAEAVNKYILDLPGNPKDPSLKTKDFGYNY